MEAWYVVVNGKPAGPYSYEDLKNISIAPDTFVRSSSMDDYKEAHEIPELRKLLGFKYQVAVPQYFATLDLRLLAVAIDYLLIGALYIFLAVIFSAFARSQLAAVIVSASGLILIPVLKFFYASVMESSWRQGTFGKYWLGLKVCNEQGLPLSRSASYARNAAKFISVLTLGIGFLSGFFNKKQQCLHDLIAGTLVIKDRLI